MKYARYFNRRNRDSPNNTCISLRFEDIRRIRYAFIRMDFKVGFVSLLIIDQKSSVSGTKKKQRRFDTKT